jgi:uncharacterized CHY-type Zn-finger protein
MFRDEGTRWVVDEKRFGDDEIRCGLCGYYLNTDTYENGINNYCPYCGRKKSNPNGKYLNLKWCRKSLTKDEEEVTS